MNISQYSILRPSVIIFFLAIMLFGGIYAFEKLGKREDSTFVIKSTIVICPYSGATPEEVENLVSKPLERGLRSLSGIHKITSESHYGYARLAFGVRTQLEISSALTKSICQAMKRATAHRKWVLWQRLNALKIQA